ncbi:MAG: PTS fructose transporter subunit IIA [Gammaproteobacteria bacterium]|nr:PTS fructose transporter subunit IIA [Gammaproteobacteria bacterium]PCH64971.1 MAG: PTS fructose transporter subunit IIA [Gammaproteobacteria bacterium]
MSVGVLLINHQHVGSGLLAAARSICGEYAGSIEEVSISHDAKPLDVIVEIENKMQALDQGSGVLILSDLYGSTPSNIATQFYQLGNVSVVLGVNLPMLIRVFNYPKDDLDKVTAKAIAGAKDGVFAYPPKIKEGGYAK